MFAWWRNYPERGDKEKKSRDKEKKACGGIRLSPIIHTNGARENSRTRLYIGSGAGQE